VTKIILCISILVLISVIFYFAIAAVLIVGSKTTKHMPDGGGLKRDAL